MSNNDMAFLEKERLSTGFGQDISSAKSSAEALRLAGMDWTVEPRETYYRDDFGRFQIVPNVMQNVRIEDGKPLGTVSGRYQICQNRDAFAFTDELLGSGVKYVRGGSFHGGRSVWIMAELPQDKYILGDPVHQYVVFTNTHDGSGAVRVMIAPMRIVCSNALNLFLRNASRKWSCVHTGSVQYKLEEARQTLLHVETYMDELDAAANELQKISLTSNDVTSLIEKLFEMPKDPSALQERRILDRRAELRMVYEDKNDLKQFGNTAYRFINAVSDYATHGEPDRATKNYNENLFERTIGGHKIIDAAYRLVA